MVDAHREQRCLIVVEGDERHERGEERSDARARAFFFFAMRDVEDDNDNAPRYDDAMMPPLRAIFAERTGAQMFVLPSNMLPNPDVVVFFSTRYCVIR